MKFNSPGFYSGFLNSYLKTLKLKITNPPNPGESCIYIFWHSKMLVGWWLFRNNNPSALVSQSKDGEILNGILTKWNYKVVRGSSSSRGKEAMSELIDSGRTGKNIIITPDGPRGPAGSIKNGALIISNKTGLPVVPVKIDYSKKKTLEKSWDKFEIPYPFSACSVVFGNKYYYDNYLDESELGKLKDKISGEMK